MFSSYQHVMIVHVRFFSYVKGFRDRDSREFKLCWKTSDSCGLQSETVSELWNFNGQDDLEELWY